MDIRLQSDKRPIVKGTLNGKEHYFLLDTGASVGIIDKKTKGLHQSGRGINIVDASGDEIRCPILNDCVEVGGKKLYQFVSSDIGGVRSSIRRETGIDITGIISYTQMRMVNAVIDTDRNVMRI